MNKNKWQPKLRNRFSTFSNRSIFLSRAETIQKSQEITSGIGSFEKARKRELAPKTKTKREREREREREERICKLRRPGFREKAHPVCVPNIQSFGNLLRVFQSGNILFRV